MKNSKIQILHCISDEKFISSVTLQFEIQNDISTNHYVIFYEFKPKTLKFLKGNKFIQQQPLNNFYNYLKLYNIQILILHNLYTIPLYFIRDIPNNIKVIWFSWGWDLYYPYGVSPLLKIPNMYWKETKSFLKTQQINKGIIQTINDFIDNIKKEKVLLEAVHRIDYYSGVIPDEYKLLNKKLYFHAKEINFIYSDLSLHKKNNNNNNNDIISNSRMDILIGNSADPSNNHLDILKKLKNIELKDKDIIVPLSYSGDVSYINKVKDVGYNYFGHNFIPLDSFMPKEEYKKIINKCGFCIFGHERQQAFGNIKISLLNCAKVFLSKTSILYKYLYRNNITIYSIQNDLNQIGIETPIDQTIAIRNRNIILELNDADDIINSLRKNLLTIIEEKS